MHSSRSRTPFVQGEQLEITIEEHLTQRKTGPHGLSRDISLDEQLRDRELGAWASGRFCHWPGCMVSDVDLLEEDHIYELVNYAKLLDAIHYFKTSFPYPYKLIKSWVICSGHHSKATQMRIRGETIEYPERLQYLIDSVLTAGKDIVQSSRWSLESFAETPFREK